MYTSTVKMRWVIAALLTIFPMVGVICSVAYHDLSMLWVSLMGAALASIVLPVSFVLLYMLGQLFSLCAVALLTLISEVFRFRKR